MTAIAFQLIDKVMKEDLTVVHSMKRRPNNGKRQGYFEDLRKRGFLKGEERNRSDES